MTGHCEPALLPYLRSELGEAERHDVERHLESCASCRDALEGSRAVVEALRTTPHDPPEIDWRRYRAELRTKLEERQSKRWSWVLPRLVPIAVTATLAGLALVVTLREVNLGAKRMVPGEDLPVFEQTALGSRLDLLKHYDVVENLDLLEDLDLVQDLDDVEQG